MTSTKTTMRLAAAVVLLSLIAATGHAQPAPAAPTASDADEAQETPYWRRAKEGWFWQKDPPPAVKPKAPEAAPAPVLSADERDLAELNEFKARLERALNVATQNPSEQLGTYPLPESQLYFFFRRNCAYCHVQGPMLKQFQQKYGFTVYAVTLDGGSLPDFPGAVQDSGLAEKVADAMGVPTQHFVVPAVVLARPSTREVVPVGFGAMTMDQMAERVAMVVRVKDGGAGRDSRNTMAALVGAEAPTLEKFPAQGALQRALQP
ncbi:MAG: hypothetical protein CFE45_03280 [Burkholderiales bacterium PBB5]|nr:MAG: hypothetical protein CFE45_03280 [Burkholderiales bacterium PBB5]